MTMLIDSHAHLDMNHFMRDLDQVLENAIQKGVGRIITVGVDLESSRKALELARRHEMVFATIGYHPHNANEADPDNLDALARLAGDPRIVAWGEIGLDFFRRHAPPEVQVDRFEAQLRMAADVGLPVIIHDREAHQAVFERVKKLGPKRPLGVIHCFSGDYDLAMRFIEMDYFISIPGTVTYNKATQVREAASRIPLQHLLVETDAPYLAPVPKRGKRNEPAYIAHTAREIARLRDMDFDSLAAQTTKNAERLFQLP